MKKTTVKPLCFEMTECPVHEDGVRVELVEGEPIDVYDAEPSTSSSVGYSPRYTDRWASVFGAPRDPAVN